MKGRFIMKKISVDNGNTFVTVQDALQEQSMATIRNYMDDELCEQIHGTVDTEEEFINAYLKHAKEDLIIG